MWKHPCARMAFPDCTCALSVGLEILRLRISQISRWRIKLSDERSGVGCELRSVILVPINAMAVVAPPFPLKTALPRSASPIAFALLGGGGDPAQAFISSMCVHSIAD